METPTRPRHSSRRASPRLSAVPGTTRSTISELLADRGFSNADASYDRAVAYIHRAESHAARPGDLGRAAAALGETLLLDPDDKDAAFALDHVHEEIARRRARAHAS